MNTKIAFVATDSVISQCLLSAISAKIHNPEAKVIVVTDAISKPTESPYIDEIVRVDIPDGFSEMERSRWLKTSLREHIEGDFLYIDCDTIICEDLSEIDDLDCNIGGVLEWNRKVYESYMYPRYVRQHKKAFDYCFDEREHYINGGVLYVKDNEYTHKFFSTWHKNWLISLKNGISFDQPALYRTERECGKIDELPGEWNCQMERNISYFYDAKILHLFGSRIDQKLVPVFSYNPYEVKDINDDFLEKLEHFKSYFIKSSAMILLGEKFPTGRTFYAFKSPMAQKMFMLIYKLFVK